MSDLSVRTDEQIVRDRDGAILREYDDVWVVEPLSPVEKGIGDSPNYIPVGCRATIILIDSDEAHLECDIGEMAFAFALVSGPSLRMALSREDKLKESVA
jgi:uncharacterized Zn ribbon protein